MTQAPRTRSLSTLQLAARWSLVLGAVAAAVVAIPDQVWLARIGVVVAVVGGLIALVLAGRHAKQQQALAAAQLTTVMRDTARHTQELRRESSSVLKVMENRNGALRGQLVEAREEADHLRHITSGLQAENTALRHDLAAVRVTNTDLRNRITDLEQGLVDPAEVVTLPRRVQGVGDVELWVAAEAPTIVNLQQLVSPYVEEAVRLHA
jgi:hypothetical protein